MVVALNTPSYEGLLINRLENCTQSDDYTSGIIVHLHPDLLVKNKYVPVHDRHAAVKANVEELRRLFLERESQLKPFQQPIPYDTKWDFTLQVWDLFSRGKEDISAELISKNNPEGNLVPQDYILHTTQILFGTQGHDLLSRLLATDKPENESDLKDYKSYLKKYLNDEGLLSPHIFKEFYASLNDYTQVLTYVSTDSSLPDNMYVSSSDFESTWQFYGNAFEHLAKLLVIPNFLNNISAGRRFDEFYKGTLEGYLEGNSYGKKVWLSGTDFDVFVQEYNNQLRNGSHHRQMHLNSESGQIKFKKSQTSDWQYISYKSYLEKCCRIMQRIACLTHYAYLKIN